MITNAAGTRHIIIELRQQAHYWQALHIRAIKREVAWKKRALEAETNVSDQTVELVEKYQQIEALKAKIVWLQQQVFGRKTDQINNPARDSRSGDQKDPKYSETPDKKRNRGKQPGAKGYGRKLHPDLPTEEVDRDLPQDEKHCRICGKPYKEFPKTEDSEEIHWEVRLVRRVYKRRRYYSTCDCKGTPRIVTAPIVPKLVPKGKFSTGFWAQLILEKFLFQRPLYRIRKALAMEGLSISQGTITGGLKRIGEVLQPLYARILERSRTAKHWHMDETGWKVFVEIADKIGFRWWLWVIVTRDTCVYLLDPSRSARVPRDHLGENAKGIASVDRYVAYKKLSKNIRLSYCWAHVRRDFIRIWRGYKTLQPWSRAWIKRIKNLYRLNKDRLQVRSNIEEFRKKDLLLGEAIALMEKKRAQQLTNKTLHKTQRKVLESMSRHWEGLTIFVDHPDIPMDNNEAERRLRTPVVGRKNYYGNNSVWSGMLTAALFTIIQTLLKNHINPKKFLIAYFDACAENGGKPPDNLDSFLPWNMSDEQKANFHFLEHPP